ncbi:MAG: hypothetical protein WBJ84_09205 [Bacteroidales bacterium]
MKTLIKSLRILIPTICSLFWLSTAQSQTYGENIFIIHDAVGKPDSTVVIYAEIINDEEFDGYMFDLPIPEGFTYVTGSAANNPGRNPIGMIYPSILDGTNTLRIIGVHWVNCPWPGNDGVVCTFELNTPEQTGIYQLVPDSVILGGPLGLINLSGVVNGIVYITPEGSVSGDANCDGVVNVVDVIKTIQYIMSIIEKPFCFANTDLNSDILVNMEDVVGTINIILDLNSGFLKH